jgi:hypothetical protein
MLHGGRGEHLAEEERAEPPGALPDHRTEPDQRVGLVEGFEPAELVEVLRLLLHDCVDHVVDRDRPQEMTVLIHDGHRQQVVLGQEPGDVFSIGHRRHLEESAVLADVHDPRGRIRNHKVPQGHDVDEVMVVGVENIDRVHRLPTADLGDVAQRLPHRPGRGNADVVGGHDAARGRWGLRQQQRECGARPRVELFQEAGAVGWW